MSKTANFISKSVDFIENLSEKTEYFLSQDNFLCSEIKTNLKYLYDNIKENEIKKTENNALPTLIIDSFDNEQIWQEVELQNNYILEKAIGDVSKILAAKNRLIFKNFENLKEDQDEPDENVNIKEPEDENSDESESDQDNQIIDENNSDEINTDEENSDTEEKAPSNKFKKSIVDDEFFKLDEMEKFLLSEEKKQSPDSGNEDDESDSEKESINLFEEESEDSENGKVRLAKYKDFFVSQDEEKPTKRNKYFEELEDDLDSAEEEMEDEEIKESKLQSNLEKRQERLKQKIEAIESNAVAEKPWQLKGEIRADSRPQNSLLEEIVEFDRSTRPAPVITEQTTLQLEDIIKQRIKDKVFDSVERKIKPIETPLEYKKKLVLDQEKSKLSLAQIYEKDFLEQKAALENDGEKEEEEPEAHKEIRKEMQLLFNQLDALSNFFYTPKPAIPELRVLTNVSAINMEEVAPVSTSDAALLAPEEVKAKPKADIIGKSERTETDKKRERRKKKQKQKHHAQEKLKREQTSNMGNKQSKEKSKKLLERVTKEKNIEKMDESAGMKHLKSSTAFFNTLQEQVKSQIQSKATVKRKKNQTKIDVKKFKL